MIDRHHSFHVLIFIMLALQFTHRPKKVLAVPAGWRVEGDQVHPIMIALQKQEDNNFTLSVINAGADGLEYHPIKPDNFSSKVLYSTSIRCAHIHSSRVEDAGFW